jgi:TPR repeat protein
MRLLTLFLFILTPLYLYAQGIPQDMLEKANAGDPEAQFNLAKIYYDGKDVEQNDKEAVLWYRKAAEQGYADAQCNLGYMYINGKGVSQNNKTAMEWFLKAAGQNHQLAQHNLGVMYSNGMGVPQDYKKAEEWYLKAAKSGFVSAQVNLGIMYAGGDLGTPDPITGCAWLYLSNNSLAVATCDDNLDKTEKSKALQLMEKIKQENQLTN